jgi:hypothetical protein
VTPIEAEVIRGIFTLIAVGLGSLAALWAFFRQKQYELAKQRYLEQGVDVIAAELELCLGVVRHNYARSLQLCRTFRDYDENFDVAEIKRGFLQLNSSNFRQVAHYRVGLLIDSQTVWGVFQHAMAHAATANALLSRDSGRDAYFGDGPGQT